MDRLREPLSPLSKGAKYTVTATGALAMTWVAIGGAQAAPADQPNLEPRFADAFNTWSLGFGGGFSAFQAPTTIESFDVYDSSYSQNIPGSNPFASVEIGRDFRFNNAVFGLYGDFHVGDRKGNFSSSDEYAPTAAVTLKEGGAVTGRAGLLLDQQTLLYGLFGWSWQHYTSTISGSDDSYAPISAAGSGVLNGPTVGLGAEVLLPNHPNISFKGEYRFTHLNAPASLSADGGNATMDFGAIDEHALRLILSFKLGTPPG